MSIFPWRRRQIPEPWRLSPAEVEELFHRVPVLHGVREREELTAMAGDFLRCKQLEPVQGLQLEPWMAWSLALQACLPVRKLGLGMLDNWRSMVVYAADFLPAWQMTDEAGVVHPAGPHSGESWLHGPLLISWDAVLAEMEEEGDDPVNVIIHEVCHQLDGRHGGFDGVPALPFPLSRSAWIRDFSQAYDTLATWQRQGKYLPLDPYALESPPEFFAVSCEAFFVDPQRLQQFLPRIYDHLARYFRQDPAAVWSASH